MDDNGTLTVADLLNATPEQEAEILKGYMQADKPPPEVTSAWYDHGRRVAINDKHGHVDPDQRILAHLRHKEERVKRVLAKLSEGDPSWRG